MKSLALMLLFIASPSFAFELMEPAGLLNILTESFPKISQVSDCYSSFNSESMKCVVNETNPADVNCVATGQDNETGQPTTLTSTDVKIVEALHQSDLSFLTFIELSSVSCYRSGGDPNICRGETETVSCNVESYMSH